MPAVLTKSLTVEHDGPARIIKYPAGVADDFFAGARLFVNAAGKVTPVPAAGLTSAGTCAKERRGAAVDDLIEVETISRVKVSGPTFVGTDVGARVFASVTGASDNPADLLPDSAADTDDIPVGTLDRIESSTVGWVDQTRKAAEAAHA